jgi:hypothetical protein
MMVGPTTKNGITMIFAQHPIYYLSRHDKAIVPTNKAVDIITMKEIHRSYQHLARRTMNGDDSFNRFVVVEDLDRMILLLYGGIIIVSNHRGSDCQGGYGIRPIVTLDQSHGHILSHRRC